MKHTMQSGPGGLLYLKSYLRLDHSFSVLSESVLVLAVVAGNEYLYLLEDRKIVSDEPT
jgi:hypothetical protein